MIGAIAAVYWHHIAMCLGLLLLETQPVNGRFETITNSLPIVDKYSYAYISIKETLNNARPVQSEQASIDY